MKTRILAALLPASLVAFTLCAVAAQQVAAPAAPAPAPDAGVIHDPLQVPAGIYVVDQQHSALIGNVQHGGLTHFYFRFRRFGEALARKSVRAAGAGSCHRAAQRTRAPAAGA